MPAGRHGDGAEGDVGARDRGGRPVDGRAPAGEPRVRQHEQAASRRVRVDRDAFVLVRAMRAVPTASAVAARSGRSATRGIRVEERVAAHVDRAVAQAAAGVAGGEDVAVDERRAGLLAAVAIERRGRVGDRSQCAGSTGNRAAPAGTGHPSRSSTRESAACSSCCWCAWAHASADIEQIGVPGDAEAVVGAHVLQAVDQRAVRHQRALGADDAERTGLAAQARQLGDGGVDAVGRLQAVEAGAGDEQIEGDEGGERRRPRGRVRGDAARRPRARARSRRRGAAPTGSSATSRRSASSGAGTSAAG